MPGTKSNPDCQGQYGLSKVRMKQIAHGARCAIKMHSSTEDVAALRHDLQNGIRHNFGDHRQCNYHSADILQQTQVMHL